MEQEPFDRLLLKVIWEMSFLGGQFAKNITELLICMALTAIVRRKDILINNKVWEFSKYKMRRI